MDNLWGRDKGDASRNWWNGLDPGAQNWLRVCAKHREITSAWMFYHLEGWRIVQLIAKTRIVPEEFNDYLDDLHREITPEELIVPYGPLPNISHPLGENKIILDSRFFVGSWPPGPTLAIDPTDSRLPPFPAARIQDTYVVGWLTDDLHLEIVRPREQDGFKEYIHRQIERHNSESFMEAIERIDTLHEMFLRKKYESLVNDPDYFLFIWWYEEWIRWLPRGKKREEEVLVVHEISEETPPGWHLPHGRRLSLPLSQKPEWPQQIA